MPGILLFIGRYCWRRVRMRRVADIICKATNRFRRRQQLRQAMFKLGWVNIFILLEHPPVVGPERIQDGARKTEFIAYR